MNSVIDKLFIPVKSKSSDFSFNIPLDQFRDFKYVVVTTASIPKSYYGLPLDSELTVITNLGTNVITIDKANYNPFSMATVITQKLAALGLAVNITYPNALTEPDTNKFTFTFTTPGITSVEISANNVYLAHMVGLNTLNESVTQAGTIWISPYPLDYQSYNKIVIKSNLVENKGEDLIAIVSNGTPYNSALSYVCPSLSAHFRILKFISSNVYRFYIVDEEENLIDFNNQEINFTICLFKSSEVDKLISEDIRLRAAIVLEESQRQ